MRIVNIILTSQNGGAEQVFLDYCKILKKLGHEVFAIVKTDAPYAVKLDEIGVETVKIKNLFGFHDFFAAFKIRKILKKFQANAVITHMGRATKLFKMAHVDGIFHAAVNHSYNVKRSIGADLVISVNKEIFYKTVDLGQNPQKSFVLSNALDLTFCEFIERKIDFQKNVINIGAMGRFDRTKGFVELIEAIKILQKKFSQKKFILKIAGDGYFKEQIERSAKGASVEFLGWIKDKESFFNEIDIFILPSLEETFGLVLLESMKNCVPIICSNTQGPKEILRENIDALFAKIEPKKDYPDEIAKKIIEMITDEESAKNLAKSAFQRLHDKFSFQRLEKDLGDIFGDNVK
jgi:glycosyltransferase involved in cell wall biosynthesis